MLLGVDVGGTFTDAALLAGDRLHLAKAPTTPADQSEGVIAATQAALERAGAEAGDVERFVHGMTVGTNALLEGRHARTALLATAGFTDVEELGRQARPSLYRLCEARPAPLVPRSRRVEVRERCGPDGVLEQLDEHALRAGLRALGEPEAAAVCLLWSFRHPEHERRVAEIVGEVLPDAHVSTSHEAVGTFREYERFATTIVDAALSPLLRRYLDRLAERAAEAGLPEPEVMLSSGGVCPAGLAARHAAWTVLSGPAGGAVGAARLAELCGEPDAVLLDMGGTSCDVSLAQGGAVAQAAERDVAGRPLALPAVDVHTVGAGGGSIAWVDPGGALRAGPHSAGADPGPASYGRGGEQPTVTDANVVLGRIGTASPLGGSVALDAEAAGRAVAALARDAGLGPEEAAAGVLRVATTEMARAARVVSVERGVDPRGLALVAFGGAGPLHAAGIAEEIGVERVLVPYAAGVLSAVGLVLSERRRDLAEGVVLAGAGLTSDAIAAAAERLGARARDDLGAGHTEGELRLTCDLRYRGQAFELPIPAGDGKAPDTAELRAAFDAAHEERYGYADPDADLELVTVRVAVAIPAPELPETALEGDGSGTQERPAGGRPAIQELDGATLAVPVGWRARPAGAAILVERS